VPTENRAWLENLLDRTLRPVLSNPGEITCLAQEEDGDLT